MLDKLREQVLELMEQKDENFNKYSIISDILKNNECFLEMDIDTAVSILKDLGYSYDDSIRIYTYLVGIDNY